MTVSLSFNDFNGQLTGGVSVNDILNEIQRVIEGAAVRRAGASIGFEAVDYDGTKLSASMDVEVHGKLGCMLQ